jgi:carboxypeptidase PM20D1
VLATDHAFPAVDTVPPGHSSMPPFETNVGILSNALARLERSPFPAHIDMYSRHLQYLAPELSLPMRIAVANPWLFSRLLKRVMLAKSTTATILRTTTAITVLRAGAKVNAVPGLAVCYVNHRIHPSDRDKETVLAYDRRVVADPRVKAEFYGDSNGVADYVRPSPETSPDAPGFKLLARTVRRVFDNAPVMPSTMVGNTDTRWYWDLTDESE